MTQTIWNDILNLFYPRLCLICQNPLIQGEEHICLHCINQLPYTYYTNLQQNSVCELFQKRIPLIAATAFLHFHKESSVQKLIHSLKYHGNKSLGYELGRMAARYYQPLGLFQQIDLLLPIPLHPTRLKERGYNQAEWIAKGIQSVTKIPIETQAIYRNKKTVSQTRKQLFERLENVEDIFKIKDPTILQNKNLLLIDDVITTGSTLYSLATTLQSIPGIQISILGIAIAQ